MLAIIQEIASKSYTFRDVVAYVTIAVCMSFAIGFLIAAFTRIFKDFKKVDPLDHLCSYCGKRYGEHYMKNNECPNENGGWGATHFVP